MQSRHAPHALWDIKAGLRRSSCVRTRQSLFISKQFITGVEMPTSMQFYSTCASPWTLVFSFCTIVLLHIFRRRPVLSFPPGPKGLPILGNALDMPCRNPWLTYSQWGKSCSTYFSLHSVECVHYLFGTIDSDIVHANYLGTHVIVLNSANAVHELFEKRSSIYSDRYVRNMNKSGGGADKTRATRPTLPSLNQL